MKCHLKIGKVVDIPTEYVRKVACQLAMDRGVTSKDVYQWTLDNMDEVIEAGKNYERHGKSYQDKVREAFRATEEESEELSNTLNIICTYHVTDSEIISSKWVRQIGRDMAYNGMLHMKIPKERKKEIESLSGYVARQEFPDTIAKPFFGVCSNVVFSVLDSLQDKYDALREFLKDQEWNSGENLDECPWCGVPKSHGVHNYGCYFAEIEKETRVEG